MEPLPLTRDSVLAALKTIEPHVHRTPLLRCTTIDRIASTPRTADGLTRTQWAGMAPADPTLRVWFKCENYQHVGAFKARGAMHAVCRLLEEPGFVEGGGLERGVCAHSSGNHAQALTWAARKNKMTAHIVMPSRSIQKKIQATREYGAKITMSGHKNKDREAACADVMARTGARLVHPYDNEDIILGAGTVGIEAQQQFAEAHRHSHTDPAASPAHPDAILVPCGGGGLLSGVAISCEGTPIRVFGAEPNMNGANDVCRGFAEGRRIPVVHTSTVADGLRTAMGVRNWDVCYERKLVARMYSVSDAEIIWTLRLVMERMKIVVEPSAVVGLAVALFDEDFRRKAQLDGGKKGWGELSVVCMSVLADIDTRRYRCGGLGRQCRPRQPLDDAPKGPWSPKDGGWRGTILMGSGGLVGCVCVLLDGRSVWMLKGTKIS
jgi:threonine dehydratase